MKNKTCITDLSIYDSTIEDTATQELSVQDFESRVSEDQNYTQLLDILLRESVISQNDFLRQRLIELAVNGQSRSEHSLTNYCTPVAEASYTVIENEIGLVDRIYVDHPLQNRGIGLQLKKLLINHMKQDGVKVAYSRICSRSGYKLAQKTQFKPETDTFRSYGKVYYRDI